MEIDQTGISKSLWIESVDGYPQGGAAIVLVENALSYKMAEVGTNPANFHRFKSRPAPPTRSAEDLVGSEGAWPSPDHRLGPARAMHRIR